MYTQPADLSLKIITPTIADILILDRLRMIEQASAPYVMTLEMHSLQHDLDLESLVGQEITVSFSYPGGVRYFGGIIGEIEQGRTIPHDRLHQTNYVAKVYPHLWLLKFSQDHQIFQNQSALDIIKDVLQTSGVIDLEDKTSGNFLSREYCVQYRESYFNYVSRLMEEEGIFYCFNHQQGKTSMVLRDGSQIPEPLYENLPMTVAANEQYEFDEIQTLNFAHQVVSQKYAAADYNFKTASTKLYSKADGDGVGLSVYRYPGRFLDTQRGDTLSTLRIEELDWFKQTIKGVSSAPMLTPMAIFQVRKHPRSDLNQGFQVYKVIHEIDMLVTKGQQIYRNEFVAFPADVPFHSPIVSPKPIIPSTQTAFVTGKPGEEVWCDEYGRIKVKFHWDQKGSNDDKSSCWIRVAQVWAGNGWGGLWTPRVGMEVVVTFLEGDPDKPLITGCVYNSDHMPMYAEKEPTKSTFRTNSSKGGHGFNELRFEDKKDAEEIYVHAEKDMNTVIEENRTLTINHIDDQTDIICGDRLVTLHAQESPRRIALGGNDSLTLLRGSRKVELQGMGLTKGDHTLNIFKGDDVINIAVGNMIITVELGNKIVTLGGNYTLNATGIINLTASAIELNGSVTVNGVPI